MVLELLWVVLFPLVVVLELLWVLLPTWGGGGATLCGAAAALGGASAVQGGAAPARSTVGAGSWWCCPARGGTGGAWDDMPAHDGGGVG